MVEGLVSVIVPIYNSMPYLVATIKSILSQTYKDIEILCCDDGSTDGSFEYLSALSDNRIRIERNPQNMGVVYTRNRLIKIARGEFLAIWDSDDLCEPERIEIEVRAARDFNADVVASFFQRIDENGNEVGEIYYTRANPNYIKACLLFDNAIPNSSALIRRKFLQEHNITYKDTGCNYAEDYLFWVICVQNEAKFHTVNKVLLYYRWHDSNTSHREEKEQYEKRKTAIRDIQRVAIDSMGFRLGSDEYECIFKNFGEYRESMRSVDDVKELYYVLKKICEQADELNLENKKEIHDLCRIKFANRIGQARFLWGEA